MVAELSVYLVNKSQRSWRAAGHLAMNQKLLPATNGSFFIQQIQSVLMKINRMYPDPDQQPTTYYQIILLISKKPL